MNSVDGRSFPRVPNMTLREFLWALPSKQARIAFATRCGTSMNMLRNVMVGRRRCPIRTALLIERHSVGRVVVESLLPDLPWHIIRGRRVRVRSSIQKLSVGHPRKFRLEDIPTESACFPE